MTNAAEATFALLAYHAARSEARKAAARKAQQQEVAAHINTAVNGHHILSACQAGIDLNSKEGKAFVRELNRTLRPALTKLAYALFARNGKVTPMNLYTAATTAEGPNPAHLKAIAASIRHEVAQRKVEANTAKVRAQAAVAKAAKIPVTEPTEPMVKAA